MQQRFIPNAKHLDHKYITPSFALHSPSFAGIRKMHFQQFTLKHITLAYQTRT